MNRLILALMIVGSVFMTTGCVTERVYYNNTPTYTPGYVSVGYHTSPYWDVDYYNDSDAYYYGYNDLGDVGYWGMYNTYQVY
ncbi:hypothetical protein OQJ18_14595 [Fluoribacter dumoffii]|uniref:Lipoprotein n=1 Tax=Fluoribacter dumoffii TaxID=463 RepID=A0A377GD56_9GAMM|nr:hypothetical protein [Fluoribacter dumoffii]KTC91059.1 hypothetical protein Ldum_2127 [Fluoribacter dumoffii NY 23]MCW8387772.1 hypothetical protein [Fluoribacter dumoffii]MCW8416670.1 hypothetical protein [Fluoribacter dumoffii]MCW8455490.1 hypothetical protein [Fluoribacter dumoffii]MCW8460431.1 hypothetical protein [Fluoribacter dumoffii]